MKGCTLERGISFVEVVATLAIIGIVSLWAIPTYQHYYRHQRLAGAAEDAQRYLMLARAQAIKTSATKHVVFQTGASWCVGATTSSSCNCALANQCNLGQISYEQYSHLTLTVNGLTSPIELTANSGESVQTGRWIFSDGVGDQIELNVNKLGLTAICSTQLGSYPSCN